MLYNNVFLPQEFIEQFRVLLPKDASSPEEISTLLQNLDLDPKTYQIGKTKVSFLSVLHHQAVQKQDEVCNTKFMRKSLTQDFLFISNTGS